jgi:molybdenum cofactor biosynthesis enzyme
MCKSADKTILIEKQGLYKKSGGKSGDFINPKLEW